MRSQSMKTRRSASPVRFEGLRMKSTRAFIEGAGSLVDVYPAPMKWSRLNFEHRVRQRMRTTSAAAIRSIDHPVPMGPSEAAEPADDRKVTELDEKQAARRPVRDQG